MYLGDELFFYFLSLSEIQLSTWNKLKQQNMKKDIDIVHWLS